MIKLNIGCGKDYKKSYINIDSDPNYYADLYIDFSINSYIPFKDSSADEIYCKNIFEHIPNPLNFLLEIKRVIKDNGRIIIITSNASYLIYHFPRKKAYHDTYNLTSSKNDKHYFMFQLGHLKAFADKTGLRIIKLNYYISANKNTNDYIFQKLLGIFIPKKFAYSDFIWR
jgi:predicted SAM-dependent methyltransferase